MGTNGTEVIGPGQSAGNTGEGTFHLDRCVFTSDSDSGNTGTLAPVDPMTAVDARPAGASATARLAVWPPGDGGGRTTAWWRGCSLAPRSGRTSSVCGRSRSGSRT